VASQCNNTIVVIHNPGIRTLDAWIHNPNVTALIYAHLPGNDAGEALAQILYGEVSPSGRLPYTVGMKPESYGSLLGPTTGSENSTSNNTNDPQINFTEGIYTDYRHFQAYNITPLYPFGHGLTYSSFNYSSVTASWVNNTASGTLPNSTPPYTYSKIPGGTASLFDVVAYATVNITNVGPVTAAEVPQLYVHFAGEQAQVHFLRGFGKVGLQPNESATVRFDLMRRDLSRWDVLRQQWVLASNGTWELRVGKSAGEVLGRVMLVR
jgi:beta-glucosidase